MFKFLIKYFAAFFSSLFKELIISHPSFDFSLRPATSKIYFVSLKSSAKGKGIN
jgi:hypothetical protein